MGIKKVDFFMLYIIIICAFICMIIIPDIFIAGYCVCLMFSFWMFFLWGKANLLSPISFFYILYIFFVGLGPVGYYYYEGAYCKDLCLLILGGLLLFILGYFFSYIYGSRCSKAPKSLSLSIDNSETIKLMSTFLLLLSLVCKIYYIFSNKELLFSSLNDGRIEAVSGNGLITFFSNFWIISILIFVELRIKGKKINRFVWILSGFALILQLAGGFRTGAISFILIIILMVNKKKNISIIKVIFLGLCILLFLVLFSIFRSSTVSNNITELLINTFVKEAYVSCINIKYVWDTFPERHTFLYGYGYLINFIMLKPGPDLDFTLTLKEIIGLEFSGGGVTPTILGEFYLNFGLIGICLGMFFFGFIFNKISRMFKTTDMYYFPAFLLVNCILAIRAGLANEEISVLLNTVMYIFICYIANHYKIGFKK